MTQPREVRMNPSRLLLGAALTVAIAVIAGTIGWATISTQHSRSGGTTSRADVGVAGPLGPDGFNTVSSYFKRVTFLTEELGQGQYIAAHLPAGKYFVRILTPDAVAGSGSDCLGVSFPLAQPGPDGGGFTGYVSVVRDGDPATVECYGKATQPNSSATFELYYLPAGQTG